MAFPRILFSLSAPRTILAPYTAGEKTPNLACDPICKLETPAELWWVRGMAVDAGDRLLEITKEDPPTAPPIVGAAIPVNAVVEATRNRARRHNRREDFMVIVAVGWVGYNLSVGFEYPFSCSLIVWDWLFMR